MQSKSDKEFYSKISIVLEEADESAFWLEILIESNLKNDDQTKELLKESIELTKIFSKTRSSIGDKIRNSKIN
jgi:four helix bundle protein